VLLVFHPSQIIRKQSTPVTNLFLSLQPHSHVKPGYQDCWLANVMRCLVLWFGNGGRGVGRGNIVSVLHQFYHCNWAHQIVMLTVFQNTGKLRVMRDAWNVYLFLHFTLKYVVTNNFKTSIFAKLQGKFENLWNVNIINPIRSCQNRNVSHI
jgi:hypothetical protein